MSWALPWEVWEEEADEAPEDMEVEEEEAEEEPKAFRQGSAQL